MKTMNTDTPSAMPLVSIIIPFYNAAEHLREPLDCVCNQSYRNLEIILVDDGSKDETLRILHDYASRDKRIQVLTQQNEYAGAARNRGMQIATGQYYLFLDGDDLFEPDMVSRMVERAEAAKADVVIRAGMPLGISFRFSTGASCGTIYRRTITHHSCLSAIPIYAASEAGTGN